MIDSEAGDNIDAEVKATEDTILPDGTPLSNEKIREHVVSEEIDLTTAKGLQSTSDLNGLPKNATCHEAPLQVKNSFRT